MNASEIPETDGLRSSWEDDIRSPRQMKIDIPMTEDAARTVTLARWRIVESLDRTSDRLLVYVGPCSIHDPESAYRLWLEMKKLNEEFGDELELVFRVYTEKPRTDKGWKGYLHDPWIDQTFEMDRGIAETRWLLINLADQWVPSTTEILDPLSPAYLAQCVAAGCIWARTTESQRHRQLAGWSSMPIWFKNDMNGSVVTAANSMVAAAEQNAFLGIWDSWNVVVQKTTWNPHTYVIMRGWSNGPNYDADSMAEARSVLEGKNLPLRFMIDCSHQNSWKDYRNQPGVASAVAKQVGDWDTSIIWAMIELNWNEWAQKFPYPMPEGHVLEEWVSITDSCVSLETGKEMLKDLAGAVKLRRKKS